MYYQTARIKKYENGVTRPVEEKGLYTDGLDHALSSTKKRLEDKLPEDVDTVGVWVIPMDISQKNIWVPNPHFK